jgi:hypothetical protein
MAILRLLARPSAPARVSAEMHSHDAAAAHHDDPKSSLLDGELADLYAAIVIVVPLALFLKSLWR